MAGAARRRTDCRLCGGQALDPVLVLPPTPPANAFLKEPAAQEVFPQEVYRCRGCGHCQLGVVVDPALLYPDYVYASSTSPVFVRHFEGYAADVIRRFGIKPGAFVVEIGSNDGVLLKPFKAAGMTVLGVDPARRMAEAATAAGLETWPDYFTRAMARKILETRGAAQVVCANNCLAHIDGLEDVIRGVADLLAEDGVLVMEVQYAVDLVQKGLWDMIYAEHLDYHTVGPLIPYFRKFGLGVADVRRVPTHGGSIRLYVRKKPPFLERSPFEAEERRWTGPEAWRDLSGRIAAAGEKLQGLLAAIRARATDGRPAVAGYGMPAKATTLCYTLGLTANDVAFVAEDSPWKVGLYSPGLHLPVVAPAALLARRPHAVILFAWNFAESIAAKVRKAFAEAGLDPPALIVPLPEPAVLP